MNKFIRERRGALLECLKTKRPRGDTIERVQYVESMLLYAINMFSYT